MNILTIDTVLDKTYVALELRGKTVFKTIESDEINYHSAYLLKVLNEILQGELSLIDYLGVNTGVGSFTGIRAGLAVSKVIVNRLNIKAVPFNTFEVLSRAFETKNIMLDARRASVFYSKDMKTIELLPYAKAEEILQNTSAAFICDNSLLKHFNFKNLLSYETVSKNLAEIELEITKEKIQNGEITNAQGLSATYIQTPPIFMKK